MSRILLSNNAPYIIMATGTKIKKLFGFHHRQLNGCILQTLEGPDTDTRLLHWAIRSACNHDRPVSCQVILYDSKGRSRKICVTCSRYSDAGGNTVGCLLAMKDSPAFTLGEIMSLLNPNLIWALTSASWPFEIYNVSNGLAQRLEFRAAEIRLASMLSIMAPDSEPSCSEPFNTCAHNVCITTGTVFVRHRSGENILCAFTCCPVVEWPNGQITHLAVILEPK